MVKPKKNKATAKTGKAKSMKRLSYSSAARMILAAYITIFLLSQLFTFDKFPGMLEAIGVSSPWSTVVAIWLVVAQLLSLPFLLRTSVPALLNRISLMMSALAMLTLSILEVLAYTSGATIIFGASLGLPSGSWSLLLLLALWLLLVWGIFGEKLQPKVKVDKKKTKIA